MNTFLTAGATTRPATTVVREDLVQGNTRQRYLALDVLRGMTIALMIIVNTPGSWETIYAPFRHATWHGFTITDLVFPTFLFVIGNAMSFSMRKFEKKNDHVFLTKVFKRTVLIFLIGLFLNSFPFITRAGGELAFFDFSSIRIMGVLQRIALCYCIASLLIYYFKVQGAVIFSGIILFAYWAILYFFGDQSDPYSLEGNAVLKLDLLLLSADNLYKGFGIPFDPEGLLGTLPAIVNVIAGYLVGLYIQRNGNNNSTVWRLMLAGIAMVVAALFWDDLFPINKPLWTSSYVLHATGLVLLVLPMLMWIIEIAGFKKWTYFFEVFGKNPLFIYVLAGVIIKLMSLIWVGEISLNGWLYRNLFITWLEGHNASLLFAISYMLLMWLIGYWMDNKKIYIKV